MRSLSDTIDRLGKLRARASGPIVASSRLLRRLDDFGENPGALNAWFYLPARIAPDAPLVVVLHGCTQTAAGYDHGAGWSQLADEYGFAVLLPEQTRANNMNLCFNWYEPEDGRRGAGEPESVRQMIETMIARHGVDRRRVFVTGLSAGGAMTSIMLATYPEMFAGGAILAGLPYGSASTLPQAFDRMRGHGGPGAAALGASIRRASAHDGPWPSVSVWHGSSDQVVDASNGKAIIAQWREIHGVAPEPSARDTVDGYPHRAWRDAGGRQVIEEYVITGMGHGTPLDTAGEDACGASGAYMLEVAISSTRHIAAAWGITAGERRCPESVVRDEPADRKPKRVDPPATTAIGGDVAGVIENALRSAGLMR